MTATAVTNPGLVRVLLAGPAEAVAYELGRATLLVPVSPLHRDEGVVRRGRSADGRPLVWAFTDDEAMRAWDLRPVEALARLEFSELARLGAVIAVNPAGPGAQLAEPPALSAVTAETPSGVSPSPLELPEARTALRHRIRDAHARGDFEACLAACDELGDRLHAATAAVEFAARLATLGSIDRATAMWERSADVLASFGESDLAVAALLAGAEAALDAGRASVAERFSVDALELAAGREFTDRLTSVWSRLNAA